MLFLQTSLCSREWVSGVKLEAIGLAEKKYRRYCIWTIWHTLQCDLSNEGSERSIGPYIRVESNQYLGYSRWEELGPLQLDMEDNTIKLIGVQKGLVDM